MAFKRHTLTDNSRRRDAIRAVNKFTPICQPSDLRRNSGTRRGRNSSSPSITGPNQPRRLSNANDLLAATVYANPSRRPVFGSVVADLMLLAHSWGLNVYFIIALLVICQDSFFCKRRAKL